MDQGVEEEKHGGNEMIVALRERAADISSLSKEIDPQRLEQIRQTVGRMSAFIPEATLVGGVALRVWLDQKGLFVPEEYGADYDFEIPKEAFEQVRKILPVKGVEESAVAPHNMLTVERTELIKRQYRRKGIENTPFGTENFVKNPENYMALEDNANYSHIELFLKPKQSVVETIDYQGHKVSILSPEELFLRRAGKIKEELQKGELQKRQLVYFYLNSLLVNEDSIDLVWKGLQDQGLVSQDQSWEKILSDIVAGTEDAVKKGEVKDVVVHN